MIDSGKDSLGPRSTCSGSMVSLPSLAAQHREKKTIRRAFGVNRTNRPGPEPPPGTVAAGPTREAIPASDGKLGSSEPRLWILLLAGVREAELSPASLDIRDLGIQVDCETSFLLCRPASAHGQKRLMLVVQRCRWDCRFPRTGCNLNCTLDPIRNRSATNYS
jgi:hypothetical protein